MKHLVIAAVLLAAGITGMSAQKYEAPQLPLDSLGWNNSVADADSVLAFTERPFLFGWNWGSTDSNVSHTLGMNVWHIQDPFMWDSVAPKEFGDTRVAGQLLVASISGVSEAAPYKDTLSERTRYRMPSESIAMEWQPWLQKQADTFALLPDDSTGGVWGFHQRDDSGTVVYDTADGCYRYRLETSKFTGQTLVLSDVECSDGFTRWETEAHPHFTTDTLYLAITLQRNDASPDTPENLDNPVLRLRVPKWWKWQCSPDSSLSKFRALPDTTGAIETVYSTFDGSYRGQRINADTTSTGPTEMVITRRMIPPINSSDKNITVYGMLVFDLKVDTNHIPADDNPDIWRNPRFVRNQRDNDNRTCIGRVSVDVTFCDELGVDIKWVRLESGSGRELFWGGFDKQICDSVAGFMARLRQYNHDSVAVPGEQPRLWRVYGRDEISPMHWKAFRYINRLLHDRVTTEWYVPDMSKARHCLRLKEYWSGETVALINNAPSPLIRHGVLNNNTNLDSLYLYAGFKKGRDDWRDFETRLEHWSKSCGNVTNRNYSNKPLPLPNDSIDFYCDSYETGVLGYVEQALKIGYANHPQLLFDTTITRYDNVWEYSSFRGLRKNVGDSLVLRLDKTTNARVKSAEEIRLQNWLPLILGSKGLFHYHGQTGALPEDVNDSKWGDIPKAGKANTIGADVGMVHQYPACLDVAALGDARIDNDSLGTDYLQDGDSSHYDKYLPHGIDTTALAMNAMAANPPGVPLFRKTMRQVVREVQRSIQPFTDSLLQMRLVAWRGQGFRHYFLGDTAAYKLWLHGDSAHQRVCIPAEQDVGTSIPRPRTEPYDSTFYDITIHSIGTAPIDQVCVIGVLNRRTDPRYDTTFGQDYVYTYDELKSRVRSNPPDLYKQYGARRLRLPFHYQGMSAQARNLRVQELRFADTTMMNMQPPIDTIIGRDVALDIDFLPGEGKFFRVSTVPASSQQGTGFLAHSNQRKIVAFPVIDSFITAVDTTYGDTVRTWRQMVPGDTMRYHRVFHRRRDSAETGALTVWYQRSQPLVLSDTLPASPALPAFDASVIEWEPPVNVSSRIMYAPPDVFPKIPQIMDLSCGFPALVVRVDTLEGNVSKVYIVFACEYKPADTVNGRVLVCETVLPADVPHQQQVDFVAGDYAVKLDEMRFYPIYPPVTPGNVLEHWGTPMINASQSGNYYCWSNSELSQIGVGFKQPHMREFLPGQTEYLRVTPGEYVATHPSMNSYSRLHIGEDDAGLIWQEGPNPVNGHDIYYTRLKHYPNNQIYHQLSADDPPVFQDPGMIVLDDNSVARVCGPQVPYNDLNYIATHSYPVLYRQMSDWNLTPSSGKYYDIGLINYKAERAYWQSTLTGNGRTVISRRMFDVAEWSSSVNGGIDTLGSKPVFIIFSTSFNLRGPDVAQGEQWWQWGSDPGYNAWDYDDSTSVLEFWSDTSTTDHFPKLWSMTMSWHLYGASGNHNLEHLVSVDSVRVLRDNGLYPHLAARYSMIGRNNRGWQRNRRIFNSLDNNPLWSNYQRAPIITTSSEHFYKGYREDSIRVVQHVGFRSDKGYALTAPIYLPDLDRWIPLKPWGSTENNEPAEFSSAWLQLSNVTSIGLETRALGSETEARLWVQRRGEAEATDLNAVAVNQDGAVWHNDATLLAEQGQWYRFFITPDNPATHAVEDTELRLAGTKSAQKSTGNATVIDLRTMKHYKAQPASLTVYPNPVAGNLTVVVRSEHEATGPLLHIIDPLGRVLTRLPCQSTDVITVNVSSWPAGTYNAILTAADETFSTSQFTVMH